MLISSNLIILFLCLSLTTSSPLDGNDVNEQFIDIVDAYYVAKLMHQSAQSIIRQKILEPHSPGKQVSTLHAVYTVYNSIRIFYLQCLTKLHKWQDMFCGNLE